MARVGIVIVTFNSAREIGDCLEAAQRTGAEIVVVDNASTDDTRGEVERRGVRLIANDTNRGFAAAVNQGIRALQAEFVLLLNPDAVLLTGIEGVVAACERPGVAGAGGCLLDAAGNPQVGFLVRCLPTAASLALEALLINRLWPRNPVNRAYRCLDLNVDREQEVEQPAGALLMIRRDVWQRLGGFDERFWPLWFEDVDYCRRALDAGFRFNYVPNVRARHLGAHSLAAISLEQQQLCWYGSLLRYTAVHLGRWPHAAVCLAVAAGALMRMGFGCVEQRSLMAGKAYGKVALLALRSCRRSRSGELWGAGVPVR